MLERGRFRAVTEPAAPNRLAAWLRLWRQQWERAPRDQRALRWFAAVVSGVLNIGFALALLWLMYLRFVLMLPPVTPLAGAPAGAGAPGDVVVPMHLLSRGSSAAAAPATPARAGAESAAAVAPSQAQSRQPLQQVTLAPQQDVRVSEPVPQIVSEFRLPAVQVEPTPPAATEPTPTPAAPQLALRTPAVPEPAVRVPELQLRAAAPQLETPVEVQAPALQARRVPDASLEVQVPALQAVASAPQLESRAVLPAAVAPARLPAIRAPGLATPQLRGTTQAPTLRPAPGGGAEAAPSRTAATAGTSTPAPGHTTAASTATSTGARPTGNAGLANDDWGRAAAGPGPGRGSTPGPGAGAGLYGADGRPDLRPGDGSLPVDRFTDKIDLANEGRWLRRPPNNYQPTVFDKYWIPSGTLLEEWVRRGVKELSIPVPGTKTSIVCVVSILQLGGACYPSNPDINDQPVRARPPPAVPFKRQYQEAQDALPAPGTPPQPPSPPLTVD